MGRERPKRDQTLDELENTVWGPPTFDSSLVRTAHRLRTVPLKQFSLGELRLMIGQKIGLMWLVPLALEHLVLHPLTSASFYRGDLLLAVVELPHSFWSRQRHLLVDAMKATDAALARVKRETDVPEWLPEKLHEARANLQDLTDSARA